jgi:hypothetical protein
MRLLVDRSASSVDKRGPGVGAGVLSAVELQHVRELRDHVPHDVRDERPP